VTSFRICGKELLRKLAGNIYDWQCNVTVCSFEVFGSNGEGGSSIMSARSLASLTAEP